VRDEIVGRQEPDGHWEDDVGKTYATAMACVVLQMPASTSDLSEVDMVNNVLDVFDRDGLQKSQGYDDQYLSLGTFAARLGV
jgi:hypothetical protein